MTIVKSTFITCLDGGTLKTHYKLVCLIGGGTNNQNLTLGADTGSYCFPYLVTGRQAILAGSSYPGNKKKSKKQTPTMVSNNYPTSTSIVSSLGQNCINSSNDSEPVEMKFTTNNDV